MRTALVAEYRKLVTTRLWWVLLLVMVGYLAFIAAVIALSLTELIPAGEPRPDAVTAALSTYSIVNGVGYVFPLILGSMVVTAEYRHQTITQSLLAEPSRTRFLLAKLLVVVPLGLVTGLLAVAAAVAGGAPVLAGLGDGARLGDAEILTGLVWGVVVIAIWAVIGVGFGSWVSNQVIAIVTILAFTQFVEPIARIVALQVDALGTISGFLPGAAADALIGASFLSSSAMGGGAVDLLPRWAALLVLLGYAVLFAVLGRLTTLRRDIG